MKSEKIGLIKDGNNYELVNTSLFPYDDNSNETCKENLITNDILRDFRVLQIIKQYPNAVHAFVGMLSRDPRVSDEQIDLLKKVLLK